MSSLRKALVVLALAVVCSGQTVLGNCQYNNEGGGSVHTLSCTLAVTGGSGHALIVTGSASAGQTGCNDPTIVLVTDNGGDTFTRKTGTAWNASGSMAFMFEADDVTGGSETVTVTYGATTYCAYPDMEVSEISGTAGFAAAMTPVTVASGFSSPVEGTLSLPGAGIVWLYSAYAGGATATAGSGYTQISGTITNAATAYQVFASSGTATPNVGYSSTSAAAFLLAIQIKSGASPQACAPSISLLGAGCS